MPETRQLRGPNLTINRGLAIGADPEFALVRENYQQEGIPAFRYFSGLSTKLGVDGASSTGEIRPSPGTAAMVTNHISYILNEAVDKLPEDVQIRAGGGKYFSRSLGGHIHFNIPPERELIDLLDYFIGTPLKRKRGGARPGGGYGSLGQYRTHTYGRSQNGFEYRTPPSWITHPKIAYCTLMIAGNIVKAWLQRKPITYQVPPRREDYLKFMVRKPTLMTKEEVVDTFLKWPSLDMGDTLVNWGIREKKLKVLFSPNDDYLPFAYDNTYKKSVPNTLLVYGLRRTRGERLLQISGFTLKRKASAYLKANDISYGYITRGNSIGFSYDLRQVHEVEGVFRNLLEKMEEV